MATNIDDITKSGPVTWRDLQAQLQAKQSGKARPTLEEAGLPHMDTGFSSVADFAYSGPARSPLMSSKTHLGDTDYWGRSFFDEGEATEDEWRALGDMRALNEPGIVKIANGTAKGFVTFATTALEGVAGLTYGAVDAAISGKFSHLWDNPITNALQKVSDASEDYLPNYYTQDEQENPWSHVFNANFLGDKLIKNFGFMVGAFYGGLPVSIGVGKLGQAAVKTARSAQRAKEMGMAVRASKVAEEAERLGINTEKALKAANLTEVERAAALRKSVDATLNIAKATRAVSMTTGALFSAINEGAIEAINNSRDWKNLAIQKENGRYEKLKQDIIDRLGNTPEAMEALQKAALDHETYLQEIEVNRAMMGNADLLLNIPILLASNILELGKLYTRGFRSTSRFIGNSWTGRMSGDLKNSTLHSNKTMKKGIFKALLNGQYEGVEEYLQRAASDGAGDAVNDALQRHISSEGKEEAKANVWDYIQDFGKAVSKNLSDPNAWEEYFIGALSATIGMPVAGVRANDSYFKIGKVGLSGGVIGEAMDYHRDMKKEKDVAKYLNERVKDEKFKKAWDIAIKNNHIDKIMRDALTEEDKALYKDLEFEKIYNDINLAASTGHLEELKELIDYNHDYTDEELNDIMKTTTVKSSAREKELSDVAHAIRIGTIIDELERKISDEGLTKAEQIALEAYREEYKEIKARLKAKEYKDTMEGPFVIQDGATYRMIDKDKAKEVLDRNRERVLDAIDNYSKIRNDIDLETDGRLTDEQIQTLTFMRAKVYDIDYRSADITRNIIGKIGKVDKEDDYEDTYNILDSYKDYGKDVLEPEIKKKEEEYKKAVEAREKAEKENKDEKDIGKLKKAEKEAKDDLDDAKKRKEGNDALMDLFRTLGKKKKTSWIERIGYRKGRKFTKEEVKKLREAGLSDIDYDYVEDFSERDLNVDEVQAYFAHENNAKALIYWTVVSHNSPLTNREKRDLAESIADMHRLARMKLEYNRKLREFLKDPELINEYAEETRNAIKQQKSDDLIEKLASELKKAKTRPELMNTLTKLRKEYYVIMDDVFNKALDTADEETKKFLLDYRKAEEFYNSFSEKASHMVPSIRSILDIIIGRAFEDAVNNYKGESLTKGIIDLLKAEAESRKIKGNDDIAAVSNLVAKAIEDILKEINYTDISTGTTDNSVKSNDNGASNNGTDDKGSVRLSTVKNAIKGVLRENRDKWKEIKTISDIKEYNEGLYNKIVKYNTENSENTFKDDDIVLLKQEVLDEELKKKANIDTSKESPSKLNGDAMNDKSKERADKMSEETNSSFISGPTEHAIYRNGLSGVPAYHKASYDIKDEATKKAIDVQKACGAYDFVNNNALGVIIAILGEDNVDIHLIRKADDKDNVYIAIDLGKAIDEIKQSDRIYGFDKDYIINTLTNSADGVVGQYTGVDIEGARYQIIGALRHTQQAKNDSPIKKAFDSLKDRVISDTEAKAKEIMDNNTSIPLTGGFIVYDSLEGKEGKVLHFNENIPINTGRLHRYQDDSYNDSDTMSLLKFLDVSGKEWAGGNNPLGGITLATVVGNDVQRNGNEGFSYVEINNKADGGVYIYVMRPDGKYYPIQCTRLSVSEWMNNGNSIDMNTENRYFIGLFNNLKVIFDTTKDINDRIHAKSELAKYLILKNEDANGPYPITIDALNGGEVKVKFGRESEIKLGGNDTDSINNAIKKFFEHLRDYAKEGAKFTVPTMESTAMKKITLKDIADSNILKVSLSGYYNFNSNVLIAPVDGDFNPVGKTGGTSGPRTTPEYIFSYSIGNSKYHVNDTSGEVVDDEGNPVTDEDLKRTILALNVASARGTTPIIDHIIKKLGISLTDDELSQLAQYLGDTFNDYAVVEVSGIPTVISMFGKQKIAHDDKGSKEIIDKATAKTEEFLADKLKKTVGPSQSVVVDEEKKGPATGSVLNPSEKTETTLSKFDSIESFIHSSAEEQSYYSEIRNWMNNNGPKDQAVKTLFEWLQKNEVSEDDIDEFEEKVMKCRNKKELEDMLKEWKSQKACH